MPGQEHGSVGEGSAVDRSAALGAMYGHGEQVREREVERAVEELGGDGLDAETRAAVERLGRRLVAGVLASPTAVLVAGDDDRVGTALELFGTDRDSPAKRSGEPPPCEDGTEASVRAGD